MSRVDVFYHGVKVGTLSDARGPVFFEYDRTFLGSGHELSPLTLPLGPGLKGRNPAGSPRLPGLFDDSLPDAWGHRVMREWFLQHNIAEHTITLLDQLSYVGHRGMGALTYRPERDATEPPRATLALLLHAAEHIDQPTEADLTLLAAMGSAGGAQPKALIALPKTSGSLLAGAGDLPPTHDAWLVKFDLSRERATGPAEEAYARMARAAGIDVPETRLLETRADGKIRRHFAIKRFDRREGQRIHHHTLSGLLQAGAPDLDYRDLLRATRRLSRDEGEAWKVFRRAAFNVLASNRDDHGKNHGFLYDQKTWKLGPAYDLTCASPARLPERGMAILGERRSADTTHLFRLAESEALDPAEARDTIDQVRAAVAKWRDFAEQARVPALHASEVASVLSISNRVRPDSK